MTASQSAGVILQLTPCVENQLGPVLRTSLILCWEPAEFCVENQPNFALNPDEFNLIKLKFRVCMDKVSQVARWLYLLFRTINTDVNLTFWFLNTNKYDNRDKDGFD